MVGGGITGVMTAYLLERAGKRVALLELGRIGQGTTGHTTAKLTVGHGLVYGELVAAHGPEVARLYAESNQAAIAELEETVGRHGIDCDWEPASNYVYTVFPDRVRDLEDEADAARLAGVEAVLTRETELPFPVEAALRVDGQAQFHPIEFLQGLASHVAGEGCQVFELTRATCLRRGEVYTVETPLGVARAPHVVLATQLPFADRGLFFAKAHPRKSYAISAHVDEAEAPRDMFINIDMPTRSIRSAPADSGARFLIVAGESGKPGEADAEGRYAALEAFLHEHFAAEASHRWSAHDFVPVDGLPYIGPLTRRDERAYVATGFSKWGLTKGAFAAGLIADAILERPNASARLYDPRRRSGGRTAARLASENAQVASHFLVDRLQPPTNRAELEAFASGEGAVVRVGARQYAVHRDESGVLHALSARCTHLGCIVGWNGVERTWECPCHGSRFAADGTLVQGPATRDLERRSLPE